MSLILGASPFPTTVKPLFIGPKRRVGALAKDDPTRDFTVELARSCHDDRCEDILVLDLRGNSPITDFFVIATGTSDRQIRTVSDRLVKLGKDAGRPILGVDGREFSHWVLVDLADVIVHVFAPEYRRLYDLELLWGDAPKVRWER